VSASASRSGTVGRFDRGADFLGAAALDDGGHLTGGGILDRNAVGPGIRGPSER